MKRDDSFFLSRRDWLRNTGTLGLGAIASAFVTSPAVGEEKDSLIYRQVLDSAPWSPRHGLGVLVFQDRLWVLGGTATAENGTQCNDVWSSEDGLQWRRELDTAPWQPRWGHAVFVFRNKLWVIGGLASVNPIHNLNDIWSSPDGKNWTLEVADAPWAARHVWAWTTHRDRMYLIGGATDGSRTYRDVISSEDGVHWRIENIHEPWFIERKYHAAASYGDRLYVAGGVINDDSQLLGGRYLGDEWSSENGQNWECLLPHAPWQPRCAHLLVNYKGRLWVVGGEFQTRYYAKDLWSTVDGRDWKRETSQVAWLGRTSQGIVVFKNKVWILGGHHRDWPEDRVGLSRNDIWTFEAGGEN